MSVLDLVCSVLGRRRRGLGPIDEDREVQIPRRPPTWTGTMAEAGGIRRAVAAEQAEFEPHAGTVGTPPPGDSEGGW